MNLQTTLQTTVDGIDVVYGRIPSGLIEGWDGEFGFDETEIRCSDDM